MTDYAQQRLELLDKGVTILSNLFDVDAIADTRRAVLQHRHLFKNTRPTPSAGHLAGFHRYPELEPLHTLLTQNAAINDFLVGIVPSGSLRTIGLSDITINRSQPWHSDLLRGRYAEFLGDKVDWELPSAGVYKVLLYLQDGASLQYIEGSHRQPKSLQSDNYAEPVAGSVIGKAAVHAGDVVVMDIRCSHRGAAEDTYANGKWDENPKVLVSTVICCAESELTTLLEIGNFHRLVDWMQRHG